MTETDRLLSVLDRAAQALDRIEVALARQEDQRGQDLNALSAYAALKEQHADLTATFQALKSEHEALNAAASVASGKLDRAIGEMRDILGRDRAA